MDENIVLLIENMSGINDKNEAIGSQTLSWNAYQMAREASDLSVVPQVFNFISLSENDRQKKQAYQLLLCILGNTKSVSLAEMLLQQLKQLDNNDECLYTVLIGLWESETPIENYMENVIFYIDDQRELIRNAAIRLLRLYTKHKDVAENALIEIIENPYDDYDLRYAVETLSIIGSKKSIAPLKEAKSLTEDYELQQLILKAITVLKR